MMNLVSRLGPAVACGALAACAVGCATVTRGTHETWKVVTSPPDATVETSNGLSCHQTPCTFKLERKAEFDVTVTRDGYKPFHGRVVPKVSTGGGEGMAGNVLIGGLIGAGVDASDGSMMDLTPNPMMVDLEKADPTPPMPAVTEPPTSASAPTTITQPQAPAVPTPANEPSA